MLRYEPKSAFVVVKAETNEEAIAFAAEFHLFMTNVKKHPRFMEVTGDVFLGTEQLSLVQLVHKWYGAAMCSTGEQPHGALLYFKFEGE